MAHADERDHGPDDKTDDDSNERHVYHGGIADEIPEGLHSISHS
jgi:hypothetical protein